MVSFNPRHWFERYSSVGIIEDAVCSVGPGPDTDSVDIALLEIESELEKAIDALERAREDSYEARVANETICGLSGALIVLRQLRPADPE